VLEIVGAAALAAGALPSRISGWKTALRFTTVTGAASAPGRHLYADAAQIAEIRERGILLSVRREELHDPRRKSGRRRRVARERTLEARLRRALDWLTGAS
jgi:hypothetical protein